MDSKLILTVDTVELVMRMLINGVIDRTVAGRLVAPWVEGDLPSSPTAESGAQTIHGLDVVRDEDGRESHPQPPDDELDFAVDRAELIRRCERWLAANSR